MIENPTPRTPESERTIQTNTLMYLVFIFAVLLIVACDGGSDDSPLPTFASPPTITPVVELVQDLSPALSDPTAQIVATATASIRPVQGGAVSEASDSPSDSTVGLTSTVIAPTPVFAVDAVTARFVPDNVKLELDGETQSVRVEAAGIDPRANGFQIHLLHPSNVEVESMSCLGVFEGGFVLGPAPLDDGALVGCASLNSVDQTSGDVMEIVLKRTAPGLAEVVIRESDDVGDAFFSEFVWPGDESGEQAIVGVEPLTVRD